MLIASLLLFFPRATFLVKHATTTTTTTLLEAKTKEISVEGSVCEDMGRLFIVNLEGKIYSCKHCRTHLALYEDIVSKSFHCRHGKAYLFNQVTNVFVGEKEERMMITGQHTVVDIFCVGCGSIVGWKYETAHEKGQKYKEGKSVLERFKLSGPDGSHYWVNHEHHHIGGSDADDV